MCVPYLPRISHFITCTGALSTQRNVWVPLISPNWKSIGMDLHTLIAELETSTLSSSILLLGRDGFHLVEFNPERGALVSVRATTVIPVLCNSISPKHLMEERQGSLCTLGALLPLFTFVFLLAVWCTATVSCPFPASFLSRPRLFAVKMTPEFPVGRG